MKHELFREQRYDVSGCWMLDGGWRMEDGEK